MAKKHTLEEEAVSAGERNVVPGQSWLAALIRGIGREMQGSQGTPFGEATREELGSLGYEQMLREQFPEEFARGRLYGSEMFPTDIASMYAMRPGRSTFAPAMAAGEGAAAGPRALRGQGTPLLNYEPVQGPTINAGFEVPRGMSRFEANQYYMTHGIPGDVVYARSNPPMPYPTSRNAFEEANVLAANKTRPSPAPANYDYQGPASPGPVTQRPMSEFDRASIGANWSGTGKGQYGRFTPGTRTGPFREGDFPPYSPEEMGQGMVPYRAQTQVQPQEMPPPNYPYRPGPVGFQLLPPYRKGGLPMMAEGEGIPYAEYRDVTGNVLTGPAREAPYGGGMDFGVTREGGAAARGGFPYGKAAAIGAGVGLPMMFAYDNYSREPMGARTIPQGAMEAPRGSTQLPPIDIYGQRIPMAGMEAAPVAPAPKATKAPKAGKKAAPTPPKRPAEMSPQQAADFEGNLNYYVTQMLDRLTGQNEAERGRMTQQYYERNPY